MCWWPVAMKMMTKTAVALLSALAIAGCATDGAPEGEDFDDPDAKADGASTPLGVYTLMNPDSFDDEPRIDIMDIRSDGTYYEEEQSLVDAGDGNYETGWSETFGNVRFTKDRYGNHYLRFTDGTNPENSWRWKYKFKGTGTATVDFIYATNEVGFSMHRATRPTATFVKDVKAAYGTATMTKIADPTPSHWTGALPDALAARVRDLRISYEDHSDTIVASSMKVDDVKTYVVEWGTTSDRHIEIFAQDSQLLAVSKTVTPLVWGELRP